MTNHNNNNNNNNSSPTWRRVLTSAADTLTGRRQASQQQEQKHRVSRRPMQQHNREQKHIVPTSFHNVAAGPSSFVVGNYPSRHNNNNQIHACSSGAATRSASDPPVAHPAVDYNTSPPPLPSFYGSNNNNNKPLLSLLSSASAAAAPSLSTRPARAFPTISNCIENGFDKFGQLVGACPLASMLFAISLASAAAFGVIGFTVDNNPDRMWSLTNLDFGRITRFIARQFPETVEKYAVIASVAEGGSILTPMALRSLLELDDNVHALPGMDALCYKIRGECVVLSVLDRLRYPELADDNDVLSVINSKDKLKYFVPSSLTYATMPDELEPYEFLGGIVRNASNGKILNAQATKLIYLIKKPASDDERDKMLLSTWKHNFQKLAELKNMQPLSSIYVSSSDARWDGGNNQQLAPYFMRPANWPQLQTLLASVGLVSVLLLVLTSRCSFIGHGLWLAVCVWIGFCLIIAFAIGIASAIGQPTTTLHPTLLLIVLVMLTPNIYALWFEASAIHQQQRAWNVPLVHQNLHESISCERLISNSYFRASTTGHMMRLSAIAVTSNTVYFLIAFVVLAFSKISVIRSLAIYGIILDLSTFIFTLIFFAPAITIRINSILQWRDACFFCCISYGTNSTTSFAKSPGIDRIIQRIFRSLARAYSTVAVKLLLLLSFVTLLAVCLYWILHGNFRVDLFQPLDYTDINTLTNQYQRADYELFGGHDANDSEINSNVVTILFTNKFDYIEKRTQIELLHQYLRSDGSIENTSIVSWFEAFKSWLRAKTVPTTIHAQNGTIGVLITNQYNFYPTSSRTFSQLIFDFLGHHHFHSDIKLQFNRGRLPQVEASRIWFRLVPSAVVTHSSNNNNSLLIYPNVDKFQTLRRLQSLLTDDLKLDASLANVYTSSMPLLFVQNYTATSFWPMLIGFLVGVGVLGWILLHRWAAGVIFVAFIFSTLLLTLGIATQLGINFDAFFMFHLFVALSADCVCATWFIYIFLARKSNGGTTEIGGSDEISERIKLALNGCAVLFVALLCTTLGVFGLLSALTPIMALKSLLTIYAITVGAGLFVCLVWLPLSLEILSPPAFLHAISVRNHMANHNYVSQISRLFLQPPNFYNDDSNTHINSVNKKNNNSKITNNNAPDDDSSSSSLPASIDTQSSTARDHHNHGDRYHHNNDSNNLIDFHNNITKHQTESYKKSSPSLTVAATTNKFTNQAIRNKHKIGVSHNSNEAGGEGLRPISQSYHALQRNLEHLSRSTSDDMSASGALDFYVVDGLAAADNQQQKQQKKHLLSKKPRVSSPTASGSAISSSIITRYLAQDVQQHYQHHHAITENIVPDSDANRWRQNQPKHQLHQKTSMTPSDCVAAERHTSEFATTNLNYHPSVLQQQRLYAMPAPGKPSQPERSFSTDGGVVMFQRKQQNQQPLREAGDSFHYHMADVTGVNSSTQINNIYRHTPPPSRPPPPVPNLSQLATATAAAYSSKTSPTIYHHQQPTLSTPAQRKLSSNRVIHKIPQQQRMSTLYESDDTHLNSNNVQHFPTPPNTKLLATMQLQQQKSGIFSYTAQEDRKARAAFNDGTERGGGGDISIAQQNQSADEMSEQQQQRGHFEIPLLRHVVSAVPSAAAASSRAVVSTVQQQQKRTAPNHSQRAVGEAQKVAAKTIKSEITTNLLQNELQNKLLRRKESIERASMEQQQKTFTSETIKIATPTISRNLDLIQLNTTANVAAARSTIQEENLLQTVQTCEAAQQHHTDDNVTRVNIEITDTVEIDKADDKLAIAMRIQEARAKFEAKT